MVKSIKWYDLLDKEVQKSILALKRLPPITWKPWYNTMRQKDKERVNIFNKS